jgi:hypothetical protein
VKLDGGWVYPKSLHAPEFFVVENSRLANQFADDLKFRFTVENLAELESIVDRRSEATPNFLLREVPVQDVLQFLLSLRIADATDQMLVTAISVALGTSSVEGVDVVLLSNLDTQSQQGRSLEALRKNLFVGRSPAGVTEQSRLRYGGDRELTLGTRPTLHLRTVLLKNPNGTLEPVTWFAVNFPKKFARSLLIEEF